MALISLTILFSTPALYRSLIATSKFDAPGFASMVADHSGLRCTVLLYNLANQL
jgi:hypothetical protein